MKFKITYGMGGGINDVRTDIIEADSSTDADIVAYYRAVEVYQEYEGLHGILSLDDCIAEVGKDEAEDYYNEEIESWIEYYALEVEDDTQKRD